MTTTGLRVRHPAVAGVFYPADADQLRGLVERLMADARRQNPAFQIAPKAVIAPHAGYVYSGAIAASAYAQLASGRGVIKRVVLIGPAHRSPGSPIVLSGADAWVTPLGRLEVDRTARAELAALPGVIVDDAAHRSEHSLEVQVPFVQVVLGDVAVLPLVTGHVDAELVARVLEHTWGGPETAIVVSTDLSHYHDHDTAVGLDRATADAILARRPDGVGSDRACGVYALRGLLVAAERQGLDVRLLDLRTSGETAGTRDRVVGYAAFALDPPTGPCVDPADGEALLDLAEAAIRARLGLGGVGPDAADAATDRPALQHPGGVFVTLEVDGVLNGCIGTIDPVEPLATAVLRLAVGAAFDDPRLPSLSARDWSGLRVKISLLGPLRPVAAASQAELIGRLRAGVDGLVLAAGGRRATFLPTMWPVLPEPADFIDHLLGKAGIARGTWPGGLEAWSYTTVEFSRSVGARA